MTSTSAKKVSFYHIFSRIATKKKRNATANKLHAKRARVLAPIFDRPNCKLPPWLPEQPLQRRRLRIALLVLILTCILSPVITVVGYGLSAYDTYTLLRSHANSGLHHLLAIKTQFSGHGMLDERRLEAVDKELFASRADFKIVQSLIDHTPVIHAITRYLPQLRPQINSARAASQIAIDITNVGHALVLAAQQVGPKLHGPLLGENSTPLLKPNDMALLLSTMNRIVPLTSDIEQQARHLSLDALPINPQQRDQLRPYMQQLPQVVHLLGWARDHLDAVGWLLGIDEPRTFLVQTMDRGELRPTGGFTGQFGELRISGGRVAPFSLRDISAIEYTDDSPTQGNNAPKAYRSWWPFANWGLRDSNLSADFPTSAQIAIEQYRLETRHKVDGVILFTPFLVQHVLRVMGPLPVPKYKEVITADNLEQRLHYYQLDNAGIRKIELVEHIEDPAQARKLFTSLVARTLIERLRHAKPQELLALVNQLMQDMKSKDVQIYMGNEQVEQFLIQHNVAAQMDRSTTHDGFYLVQANVSANKASQYVRTSLQDTVYLDSQGGATHHLQMHLAYTQIGPVYGLDTYRDYVRLYVPPTAKFLSGNGFDTGEALCGGVLPVCPATSIYAHDELLCPKGLYDAGAAAPMLGDPFEGGWHPLDTIGPPDNLKSDEPEKAMFGGYVVVPKNCTMTVTLNWYVPPVTPLSNYSLLVQRQAGTYSDYDLTILPSPGNCAPHGTYGLHFSGLLTQDTTFTSRATNRRARGAEGGITCYPGSHV